ncbi:MAG: RNA methyltransferase [Chitinophagales bacterium]
MRKWSMTELNRLSVEEFKETAKTPLAIVLDNVRSANNVGSVFRTADAFALEGLHLCGITACPPQKDIRKTALGASDSVDWTHWKETSMAIRHLKEEGYKVIAIEQAEGSIGLQDFRVEAGSKYAVVFGHEVKGVSKEVMELVDACIEIPQFGTKHSLNIAVSVGVIVWDLFAKIRFS